MSLGLNLYLSAARRAGARASEAADHDAPFAQQRPDGPLIWFHLSSPQEISGFQAITAGLSDEVGDLTSLLTSNLIGRPGASGWVLPPGFAAEDLPADTPQSADRFLDFWRPDVVIWSGTGLRPALIVAIAERGIPLFLIDAAAAAHLDADWRGPGVIRPVLQQFNRILTTDAAVRRELIRQGAEPETSESVGRRQAGVETPSCDESQRADLSARFSTRPVWLAAAITEDEEPFVIAAHQATSRLAYRLLLILVPSEPARGAALATSLEKAGWTVRLRSAGEEPDEDTQIFIADEPDEMGLWLRLAPIAFLGGSLAGAGATASPLGAAALGSAILHGPSTGIFSGIFEQMDRACAARLIATPADLGGQVEALLAPDIAAGMAHAAWEFSSSGAEATDRIIAMITTALDAERGS